MQRMKTNNKTKLKQFHCRHILILNLIQQTSIRAGALTGIHTLKYNRMKNVKIFVSKLQSVRMLVESILPYIYFSFVSKERYQKPLEKLSLID